MDVLYYSNYCKHSKELLSVVAKSIIKQNLYFVCIDKRVNKGGVIHVVMENGKDIKLPEIIKTVPSMILFSRGNLLLEGNDIYNYIKTFEKKHQVHNDEPSEFSLNYNSFSSDLYSFLDTTPEDMNAKGNGGIKQMHNYVAVEEFDAITTPPENYQSNRISSSDDSELNKFIEQREKDIPKHTNPLTGRDV